MKLYFSIFTFSLCFFLEILENFDAKLIKLCLFAEILLGVGASSSTKDAIFSVLLNFEWKRLYAFLSFASNNLFVSALAVVVE